MTQLILRVSIIQQQAVFEILDDGCGIPPKRLETIFTGYDTAEHEMADSRKNAGIGLSVCATIIKAIWGGSAQEGSIKKLQVNMAHIRRKFGDKPGEANYITNELGIGYRLNE